MTVSTAKGLQDSSSITNTSAVSLRGLNKIFGDITAVSDLDLEIPQGEFFSMLGPSGSGKTTVLRIIAGFETATAGQVFLDGSDVTELAPFDRDVNTVFQDYALFPHMSIQQNVEYGLRARKIPKAERAKLASEAIESVKLTHLADRLPHQLSGGQRQRIALARALVLRPKVLLLDEPLGALDRQLREEMQVELKRIQREVGITFIFVTHDQEEAMSMSDRIAIMLDGHIEQLGDPETVYEHPSSAFVAGFIGRNNFWQGLATEHGIRADDGTEFVASRPEEDVPNGQPALAAVRPECINLSAERPADSNNVTAGVVAGVSHFGDVLQYVVTVKDRDLLVLTPRAHAARFQQGDNVFCHWSADDVYLFSARQADIVMTDGDEEIHDN